MKAMENIVKSLKEYSVPSLNVNFIDRLCETKRILNVIDRMEIRSWIHVITGPWGCGKSEWARALVYALSKVDKYNVIYLDLTEKEIDKFYATTKRELVELVEEVIERAIGDRAKVPWYVYRVLKEIYERMRAKGKDLIIIFDEITYTIKRDRYEFEAFVNSLSQKLIAIAKEYSCKAHAIVITSDQLASKYFTLLSGKFLSNYVMWNLDKDSFGELVDSLSSPLDVDGLWNIIGGNPRALAEIWLSYEWNLPGYVKRQIDRVGVCIREKAVEMSSQRGVTYNDAIYLIYDELNRVVDNVEELDTTPLWDVLLRENIAIYVDNRFHKLSRLPSDVWISSRCALQLPVYYWILKAIAKRKTLNVSVESVMDFVS